MHHIIINKDYNTHRISRPLQEGHTEAAYNAYALKRPEEANHTGIVHKRTINRAGTKVHAHQFYKV